MPASPETDVREEMRLLAAIAAGDRDAFRRLYAHYSAPLFSLAIRLVGDPSAAEEALQDAFVKIWSHAADYDARKSRPFTWAVTILRRTCIDHLRRRGRQPTLAVAPDDIEATVNYSTGETGRQFTETRETSERVQHALSAFAPPQREALELALYSTLTHAEIAARLAQPAGTVKTWIRRGLLELRDALKETVP
jgi:RNA polymerase sigma-70 factor (ECF subfamily)